MPHIYTLTGRRRTLRFSFTGFALFWGGFPRKTFQFHWAGYIPFYLVWGDELDRHTKKLFR